MNQPPSPVAPTPGPWREGVSGNFRIYGPGNMGRQSGIIAEAYPIDNADIQRANVRLIANAPETAAERDRLVKDRDSWKMLACSSNVRCDRLVVENKGLVKVLKAVPLSEESCHRRDGRWRCPHCYERAENPHAIRHNEGCYVPTIRAALDKVCKP